MGSDNGYDDSKPAQSVYLDSFYIDKYEVTNSLYRTCVAEGICLSPSADDSGKRLNYYDNSQFDQYPVVYVDWYSANAFCKWRGMRLPTEAEWEKSAQGTDGHIYPWGDDHNCGMYSNCNTGDTTRIGSYEAGISFYGVYDMAGNVAEWVSSLNVPYPYNVTDGREDLVATGYRIVRGGSWNDVGYGRDVRSFVRVGQDPHYGNYRIGFRCAKDETP